MNFVLCILLGLLTYLICLLLALVAICGDAGSCESTKDRAAVSVHLTTKGARP